jgi:hypothetical protein
VIVLDVYDINDVSIINETTYQCGFVHGSIALGCHIVMVSSDGHNYTINISRLQSTGSCITDIQPGHYTLYAYDIDYNGFIPHLPAITIPNIIIIYTTTTTTTVSTATVIACSTTPVMCNTVPIESSEETLYYYNCTYTCIILYCRWRRYTIICRR